MSVRHDFPCVAISISDMLSAHNDVPAGTQHVIRVYSLYGGIHIEIPCPR